MAATSPANTIDPSKEYTEADYAAMQAAIQARNDKLAAEQEAKRAQIKAAVSDLTKTSEFTTVRAAVKKIIADNPRDDNFSIHLDALDSVMGRLIV